MDFRKAIALILCFVTVFSVAACKKEEEEPTIEPDTDTSAVTEAEVALTPTVPDNINPLTGLEASYGIEGKRPVAVMLNNIWQALPQVGIGEADVLFECLAEGGITRLMGVFGEYEELGVIGSVRSSRPYYLDFAQMFDAIYCHAGGSEDAYSQMSTRSIDHIDGVRGDPLGVYYRDQERLKTMSLEHTMMTTGDGIVRTIEHCGFRTDLRSGFEYPFEFAPYGEVLDIGGDAASHIHLPISNYQTVDYIYDADTALYSRYQYDMTPHIDGGTGEQLTFTNVIVLYCNTAAYDSYGRLKVDTVGSGSGMFCTGGKCTPITWSRSDLDGNLTLTVNSTGEALRINRGKTFINVCSTAVEANCTFTVE